MNDLSNVWLYVILFLIGTVFQAGGFFYVTRGFVKKVENLATELTQARLDIEFIKGLLAKQPNGGKKR